MRRKQSWLEKWTRARASKRIRSLGIDSMESIPPAADSLCSLEGRYDKYGYRTTGPPGCIGWRNRFLGSLNVYKFRLRIKGWVRCFSSRSWTHRWWKIGSYVLCQLHYIRDTAAWKFVKFKFKEPRIDSKESIPPAYVALWAGTTTLFDVPAHQATKGWHGRIDYFESVPLLKRLQIRAQGSPYLSTRTAVLICWHNCLQISSTHCKCVVRTDSPKLAGS